ncbi:MAG: TetR/AcrR family transcriptional regulator, regulator of cefoperazone and chloramphenicol [Kosmotogales bacterium]|nr:TetR/AcrR family transcriptional regulator, regulator of cefoperazone and chloramphenicol [Kosmotogales bacterium]
MTVKEATRERILKVTKELLNKEGIGSLSIRKIASEAGVNVASINYHFGSKNKLLFECMKDVVEKLEKTLLIFDDDSLSEEDRVKIYLYNVADVIINDAAIQASMSKTFVSDIEFPDVLIQFIARFYRRFKEFLENYLKIHDEEILSMIVEQTISAIWFPIISYKTSIKITGIDFKEEDTRKKYIDLLVENIKGRVRE